MARYPGTDFYTQNWNGPPVPTLLPWGQLATVDLLNSAIGLAADPSQMYVTVPSQLDMIKFDCEQIPPNLYGYRSNH